MDQIEETYLYKINNFVLYKLEQLKEVINEYTISNYPITSILLNYLIFSNLILLFGQLFLEIFYFKEVLRFYQSIVIYSIFLPILPYININSNILITVFFASINYNNNIFINIANMILVYFLSYILIHIYIKIPNGIFKNILSYGILLSLIFTTFFTIINPLIILFVIKVFLYLTYKISNITPLVSLISIIILKIFMKKIFSSYIEYTFIALYISSILNNGNFMIINNTTYPMNINYIINDILYYFIITGLFYFI